MAASSKKLATAEDLAALSGDVRAEVIHGMIVEKEATSFEHGGSQFAIGTVLGRRFQRHPGGRWPGGWWFAAEAEVEHERHEVFAHDAAGWRRDRMPERPTGRPCRLRPDWVCELLSPSNPKRDTVDKFQVLHKHGLPHYWIADPVARTLHVYRWTERGFLVSPTAAAGDVVRAEPFDAVELRVSALFGLEEDEE